MNQPTFRLLVGTVVLLAPLPALAAFQCPAADALEQTGNLTLSTVDVSETGGAMSSTLKATIGRMRSEGLKNGAIIDRLIVADCANIDANTKLSDDDKANQVRRFASKLAYFIYNGPGRREEAIVLDILVPTPLYVQLQKAAQKAGLTEEAWVNHLIAARLGKP